MTRTTSAPSRVPTAQRPGRPLGFDPDAALQVALDLFWRNGFAATSLDMVSEASGVARPSLTRLFGDKKALYVACLGRFRKRLRSTLGAALRVDGSVVEVMEGFCRAAIDLYMTGAPHPLGCLVINTAPSAVAEGPEIRAVLHEALSELDGALADSLQRAKQRRELAADADVKAIAFLVAATVQSLALRARAGDTRAALVSAAKQATEVIFKGRVRPKTADAKRRGRKTVT